MSGDALIRPEVDRLFEVLCDRHCRLIVLLLGDGAVETEDEVIALDERDPETAAIELVHVHLPKLEEHGYVEWEPETGAISKGPSFGEAARFLELLESHTEDLPPADHERSWRWTESQRARRTDTS